MPRIVDHAERRREIVYALWMVIHRQGIAAASLRAVADEAGVSIGRIQHYFANKEELVREGCREMIAIAKTQFGGAGETGDGADPAAALATLAALARHAIPMSDTGLVAVSVWHAYLGYVGADPIVAETVREAVTGGREHVAALFAGARRRAHPDALDRADALRLAALSDGLVARVLVGAISSDEAFEALRLELNALVGATRATQR